MKIPPLSILSSTLGLAVLALTPLAVAQDSPEQLAGVSGEFAIKSAKDLGVTAPVGEKVVVLDQGWVGGKPEVSQTQDHHNGMLQLDQAQLSGGLKVKGKLFVPGNTTVMPTGLRFTLRQQTMEGMNVLAEATLPIEGSTAEWADFVVDLPEAPAAEQTAGRFLLMFSALPLAGPVYLDDVHVIDSQGNELWAFPSFE